MMKRIKSKFLKWIQGIIFFLSVCFVGCLIEHRLLCSPFYFLDFYFLAKSSLLEDARTGHPRQYDDVFFATSTPSKVQPNAKENETENEELDQGGFLLNSDRTSLLAPRDILARAFTGNISLFIPCFVCSTHSHTFCFM